MSKDANSFGHDKALAWESRGFVYTKKRMHRFDTPSYFSKSLIAFSAAASDGLGAYASAMLKSLSINTKRGM